ncbi:hypothetical protein Tco_0025258, partial [Tanacetum coccineum]
IPPSAEVIKIDDHTIADELRDAASGKGQKRVVVDSSLPSVKKAKTAPSATLPQKKKNPSTGAVTPSPDHEYQDELGSVRDGNVGTCPAAEWVAIVSAPAYEAGTYSAALGDASPVDDFYESQTIDSSKAKDVYISNWDITNDFKLDDIVVGHVTALKEIRNVSPNGLFGNEVYGSDSEEFGVNSSSNEFRFCNSDELWSVNGGGLW